MFIIYINSTHDLNRGLRNLKNRLFTISSIMLKVNAKMNNKKTSTKRILHIIDSLGFGGAERDLVGLLQGFQDKKEYEFALVFFNRKEGFEGDVKKLDIPLIYISHSDSLWKKLQFLKSFIKDWQPNLIHSWSSIGSVLGLIIYWQSKIKLINNSMLGGIFFNNKSHWLRRIIMHLSPIVITNSIRGLKVNGLNVSDKNLIVRNGIDLKRFNITEKEQKTIIEELELDRHYPRIICTANFHTIKDHPTLIHSFKTHLESSANAAAYGSVNGIQEKNLKELVKNLFLDNSVYFLGYRKNVEVLVSVCQLFVLATKGEGCPNAILEAMALGVPVISNDVGGMSELIIDKQNGFLTPLGDIESLSKAMLEILDNPELAHQLTEQAKITMQKEYTLERRIKDIIQIYENILVLKK